MPKGDNRNPSWDFYSGLIIVSYLTLQIIHWQILPQFIDIYYHLLTAWGFIQAGGYTGWDFWQYAPVGRIHIYPPLFHLILSFLIKLGINKIILAKFFETAMPVVFLVVLWSFIRKHYKPRLAFFVMLTFSSSYTFYLSLLNHLPATLALVFGFLAFDQLFQKKFLRPCLLLTLCFYTHIGMSWFLCISFILYAFFNKEYRKLCLLVFISAFILSLPILIKQLSGVRFISFLGLGLKEKYSCQIKVFDYILAFFGLALAMKADKKYRLFLSLFLASFIFLIYPYRFFSAEGYLPIFLLSALFLDGLCDKIKNRKVNPAYFVAIAALFIIFISPTLSLNRAEDENQTNYKINISDSAFIGMVFVRSDTIWFPREYLSAANLVRINTQDGDIIYSDLSVVGLILGSISERATANALFPEIPAAKKFDPILTSKIIVLKRTDDPDWVEQIITKYNLLKIGESKSFILYKNPLSCAKINIQKASIPFLAIALIGIMAIVLLWLSKNMK